MAQTYDFHIEQGTDSSVLFILKDSEGKLLDLNGFDCRMQVRRTKSGHTLLDNLTVENGRISIDVNKAQIEVKFPNEVTSKLPAMTMVYDIELISASGYLPRLLSGSFSVSA